MAQIERASLQSGDSPQMVSSRYKLERLLGAGGMGSVHAAVDLSTSTVLADEIKGPGLTVEQAKLSLAGDTGAHSEQRMSPRYFAYGCNMCLRMSPIREHGLRFD